MRPLDVWILCVSVIYLPGSLTIPASAPICANEYLPSATATCVEGARFAVGVCSAKLVECDHGRLVKKSCPGPSLFDSTASICAYNIAGCEVRDSPIKPYYPPVFAHQSNLQPKRSRAESPSNFYDEGRPSDIVTTVYSQPSFERTASLEYANGNFNYEDRGAEAKSLYNEVVSEDNTLRPVNLNYEDRGAKSKPLYHEVATQDASRGQYYAQPESATFVSEDRASNPAVNFAPSPTQFHHPAAVHPFVPVAENTEVGDYVADSFAGRAVRGPLRAVFAYDLPDRSQISDSFGGPLDRRGPLSNPFGKQHGERGHANDAFKHNYEHFANYYERPLNYVANTAEVAPGVHSFGGYSRQDPSFISNNYPPSVAADESRPALALHPFVPIAEPFETGKRIENAFDGSKSFVPIKDPFAINLPERDDVGDVFWKRHRSAEVVSNPFDSFHHDRPSHVRDGFEHPWNYDRAYYNDEPYVGADHYGRVDDGFQDNFANPLKIKGTVDEEPSEPTPSEAAENESTLSATLDQETQGNVNSAHQAESEEELEGSGETPGMKRSKRSNYESDTSDSFEPSCADKPIGSLLGIGACRQNYMLCRPLEIAYLAVCPLGELFDESRGRCVRSEDCGKPCGALATPDRHFYEVQPAAELTQDSSPDVRADAVYGHNEVEASVYNQVEVVPSASYTVEPSSQPLTTTRDFYEVTADEATAQHEIHTSPNPAPSRDFYEVGAGERAAASSHYDIYGSFKDKPEYVTKSYDTVTSKSSQDVTFPSTTYKESYSQPTLVSSQTQPLPKYESVVDASSQYYEVQASTASVRTTETGGAEYYEVESNTHVTTQLPLYGADVSEAPTPRGYYEASQTTNAFVDNLSSTSSYDTSKDTTSYATPSSDESYTGSVDNSRGYYETSSESQLSKASQYELATGDSSEKSKAGEYYEVLPTVEQPARTVTQSYGSSGSQAPRQFYEVDSSQHYPQTTRKWQDTSTTPSSQDFYEVKQISTETPEAVPSQDKVFTSNKDAPTAVSYLEMASTLGAVEDVSIATPSFVVADASSTPSQFYEVAEVDDHQEQYGASSSSQVEYADTRSALIESGAASTTYQETPEIQGIPRDAVLVPPTSTSQCDYDPLKPSKPISFCHRRFLTCTIDGSIIESKCRLGYLFDHTLLTCVPALKCGQHYLSDLVAKVSEESKRSKTLEKSAFDYSTPGETDRGYERSEARSGDASICGSRGNILFRHPEKCERVLQCFGGDLFELPSCSKGLAFNEKTQRCDYKGLVRGCGDATQADTSQGCDGHPHGAHIADDTDCTVFYRCVWDRLERLSCPKSTVFNPALSVCDYPSAVPRCANGASSS